MALLLERIRPEHAVAAFSCGKCDLDDFLRKHALENDVRGLGNTVVAINDDRTVVGFFTLCSAAIACGDLPPREARGLPRYPLPGIRLARMAVDQRLHGQRLGSLLLIESMRWALAAGQRIGWRYFLVDAMDEEVIAFYSRFGFQSLLTGQRFLYLPAKTVATVVAAATRLEVAMMQPKEDL